MKFQHCPEETTNVKNPVIWPDTLYSSERIISDPLCLNDKSELITRQCNATWIPKREDVPDCQHTQSRLNNRFRICPPNFNTVSDVEGNVIFCYQLTEPQSWNYPCLKTGSSETIYDLKTYEMALLMKQLNFAEKKLIWLPAKRMENYAPVVWTTIGDDWGENVDFEKDDIHYTRLPIVQACLLLDLDKFTVKTDNCSFQYPSICIYRERHLLQLHCPDGYASTRYAYKNGKCVGYEISESPKTWKEFVETKCEQPLQILSQLENSFYNELKYQEEILRNDVCWTALSRNSKKYYWYPKTNMTFTNWDSETDFNKDVEVNGVINAQSRWLLYDQDTPLPCMACEKQLPNVEVEMSLSFVAESNKLFLTVYNFKSVWREDEDDPGVQCFSNAEGFVVVVDVKSKPYKKVNFALRQLVPDQIENMALNDVEKVVYEVEIISDKTGEYWCEGFTSRDFKFIRSPRALVTSKNPDEHLFVLKFEVTNFCVDPNVCNPDIDMEMEELKSLLDVKSVRIMEIENIDDKGTATILSHINVGLKEYEKCLGILHCNIVRAYSFVLTICQVALSKVAKYKFISLKSTTFCLPIEDSYRLHWEITPIGDNTAPNEFCMQSNGLPVTRACRGTFVRGGEWMDVIGECSHNYEPSNTTSYLYSLAKGKTDMEATSSFVARDLNVILNDTEYLIPADIYFLSLSLKMIVEISDQNESLVELGDALNIATAINSIMNVEESYLNLAQTMNSSNILLESIDMIMSKIAQNETDVLLQFENGVDLAVMPLFVVQISNPSVSNITGIALSQKHGAASTLFTDMIVTPLTSNMTVADVLNIERLEVATWIPQELLDTITAMSKNESSTGFNTTVSNIIVTIFYNDVVFQETKKVKDVVNSRIVSVTLPGYESDLLVPLPLIYRKFNKSTTRDRTCSYWDFNAYNPNSRGQWSKKGCYSVANYSELDVCACFHLTHFAQLILGHRGNSENPADVIILGYHGRALNAITLVGCSLSLIGVFGIAATAIIFRSWRQKPGTKVLLQLSAAIALQSVMMVSQDGWYESDLDCVILGALLHYSVLAAFMWMLITAILQFARYVKVLGTQRPTRFLIKFSLAGWGLPILPVAILLAVNHTAYLPQMVEQSNNSTIRDPSALCYPQGLGLYLSVLLPVGCIVITNLTVFIMVMRSITMGPDGKRRTTDPEIVLSRLRLSVILFFLLGLSWIFGLLAITGDGIIFSYLFCLTATLQGFVLFIYFVICDPATRVLWVSLVRERSISKDTSI